MSRLSEGSTWAGLAAIMLGLADIVPSASAQGILREAKNAPAP